MNVCLRHVADHLSPLSRATFRTLDPGLMDAVIPSPVVAGVAGEEFRRFMMRWRDRLTHVTILIDDDDYEGILDCIPSLQCLVSLDIRSAAAELNLWMLEHLPSLVSVQATADKIVVPDCDLPNLQTMSLVAAFQLSVDFHASCLPRLRRLAVYAHTLNTHACDLPASLREVRVSAQQFPLVVFHNVFHLTGLRHLEITDSRLTYVPPEIAALRDLETLSLRGNFLTVFNSFGERDEFMLPIQSLDRLRELDLSDNVCVEVSNHVPNSLEVLDVRGSPGCQYTIEPTASLPNLRTLYCSALPTRAQLCDQLQNTMTVVYAPPSEKRTVYQAMLAMLHLRPVVSPFEHRKPLGTEIPTTLDGLQIFLEGDMSPDDIILYKDL
ncbi:MAG: leucine-rich repeat domain-containing protein [Pontimonas sp.]